MPKLGLAPALAAFAVGVIAADATTLAAAGGAVLLCGAAYPRWHRAGSAMLLSLFCAAGVLRALPAIEEAGSVQLVEPVVATLEGRVAQRAWRQLELSSVRRVDPGPRLPARIRLRERQGRALLEAAPRAGWVRVRARVRPLPGKRNPGGRDPRRAFARRGIGAQGWLVDRSRVVQVLRREESHARALARGVDAVRGRMAQRLRGHGTGGALLAALSLGERGALGTQREAFRALGLSHLLAISGLHLALVGVASFRVFLGLRLRLRPAPTRDPRPAALAMTCLVTAAYAALSGAGIPVRRAWIMWCAWVGACCLRRPARPLAPLALAAAALLVADPAVVADPGAQLSFAACAGLLLGRGARGSPAARSAEVIAATAPIAASWIGVLSPWALLANLVAVPWTALVLLPAALIGAFATLLPGSPGDGLVGGCVAVAELSLSAVNRAAASLPAPLRVAPGPGALLASILLAGWVVWSRWLPGKLFGAAAIPFLLAVLPVASERPSPPRVLFLDVGQGDAALVEGRKASVLIDGGRAAPGSAGQGATTVLPALAALGIRRLDLVVASHADLDHRGGLEAVVREVSVGELWLPPGGLRDAAFAPLLRVARDRAVRVSERGKGSPAVYRGDLRVAPLWPPRDWAGSGNDRSLVVRVDVTAPSQEPGSGARGVSVLFPGDIEAAAERALLADPTALRADILKLPHHGSRTSSTRGLLRSVGPAVAVASAARHHRFGMPHPETEARVRERGASLWHTGRHGAVWVALRRPFWVRGTGGWDAPVGASTDRAYGPPTRAQPRASQLAAKARRRQ